MKEFLIMSYLLLMIAIVQKYYGYWSKLVQDKEALIQRLESMRLFLLFIYILLIVICLGFAALNATPVELKLYWMTLKLPLAFIMVSCFAAGLVLGAILFILKYASLKHTLRKSKHQILLLEKEIKNLRAIPIQDSH